jgi:hypothetical protein
VEAGDVKTFDQRLAALLAGLDPEKHARERAKLVACRSLADLEALARDGWLTPAGNPRIKLVRHGSGTFLVVNYDDGWSSTLAQG